MNYPEKEDASYIFGKKITGKKAIVTGAILGVLCGLIVVGLLAIFIFNIF